MSSDTEPPLVAIGGVGGSGTRVVAQCLQDMGFFLGSDLNESVDNLWFTLLFKRLEVLCTTEAEFRTLLEVFLGAMHAQPVDPPERMAWVRSLAARDRLLHPAAWLTIRADTLLGVRPGQVPARVGWKEPNTHIVLERLAAHLPRLRYIHVMRNGLDMAYSSNQNQPRLWGHVLTGQPYRSGPAYSLKYWRKAHERVFAIGREMGERFLLLNFDELCANPVDGVRRMASLAGVQLGDEAVTAIAARVRQPPSLARHRGRWLSRLDPDDIDFVARCGFAVG